MTGAGIMPGDIVVSRAQEEARKGDIVAAWIEGQGNTLKKLCRDRQGFFLRAESPSYPGEKANFGRNFRIQGVAVTILKDINSLKEQNVCQDGADRQDN